MRIESFSLENSCVDLPGTVAVDVAQHGPGLIAFIGENGSGKSHVLETFVAACYGVWPSYREPMQAHLRSQDGRLFADQMTADVTFTLGGHRYRVKRRHDATFSKQGKTEAWLWVDDGEQPVAGERVGEVERELAKILPPLEVLLASNFACQSHEGSFFELSKADRKALFIKLLGLERLQVFHRYFTLQGRAAEEELEKVRAELQGVRGRKERATALQAEIAERQTAIDVLAERETAAKALLQVATDAESSARTALTTAESRAGDAATRRGELDTERAEVTAAIDATREKIARFDQVLAEEELVRAADVAYRAATADLEILARDEAALRSIVAPLHQRKASLDGELSGLRDELKRLRADKDAADAAQGRLATYGDLEAKAAAYRQNKDRLTAAIEALEEEAQQLEAPATMEQQDAAKRVRLETQAEEVRKAATLQGVDLELDVCSKCVLTTNARNAIARLALIEQELSGIDPATPANERLRAIATEVASHRASISKLVEPSVQQLAALQNDKATAGRLDEIQGQLAENVRTGKTKKAELDQVAEELRGHDGEASGHLRRRGELEARLEEHRENAGRLSDVVAASTGKTAAEESLATDCKRLQRIDAAIATLPVVDVDTPRGTLATAVEKKGTAAAAVAEIEAEAGPLREKLHQDQGELRSFGEVDARLGELEEQEAALARNATEWAHLAHAFGPSGIQALEIDSAGPGVTSIANDLLASCYGDRFTLKIITTAPKAKGKEMKEVFDVAIIDGVHNRVGTKGSGGQMVVMEEALRLAIAIYNAKKGGYLIETLWRDETAGALSPNNASRYVQMLRKARELGAFHQVWFISHAKAVWQQADVQLYVANGRVTDTPGGDTMAEAA